MKKIRKAIKNPIIILFHILRAFRPFVPDKFFLSVMYRAYMGKWIDWNNPKTFCEKLQWLKLYNRNPIFTKMVDKYSVKDYVKDLIGEKHIIPTIALFENPDKIDWDILPDEFVLKTTHGGGCRGVVICRDKSLLDKEEAVKKLWDSYRTDIYNDLCEWPYKNVKKRIIAEKLLIPDGGGPLNDYKIMCFNGQPHYIMYVSGRFTSQFAEDFYDIDWNLTNISQVGYSVMGSSKESSKPIFIDQMLDLTRILAKGMPHVRVDWYYCNGNIYFGEYTFFDGSGLVPFANYNDELHIGELIDLNLSFNTK